VAFWANMSSLYQNKGLDELYPMVQKSLSDIKLYWIKQQKGDLFFFICHTFFT